MIQPFLSCLPDCYYCISTKGTHKRKIAKLIMTIIIIIIIIKVQRLCFTSSKLFPLPQRFGTALVPWGQLHLKQKQYADDMSPVDKNCECSTCKRHSRAYINSLLNRESVACHLLTIHNLNYQVKE